MNYKRNGIGIKINGKGSQRFLIFNILNEILVLFVYYEYWFNKVYKVKINNFWD